jgi:hypothetical protein
LEKQYFLLHDARLISGKGLGPLAKTQMAADGPALHVYPIEKTDNYVDRPENFTPNESEF